VQNLKMFESERSIFSQSRSGVGVKTFRLRTPLVIAIKGITNSMSPSCDTAPLP